MVSFQKRPQFRSVKPENRASSGARGYGRRWQKYSQARLFAHPLCIRCGAAAQCTDHILPVTGPSDPLFWLPSNHQSLCHKCHGRKTATETNGEALRHGTEGPQKAAGE